MTSGKVAPLTHLSWQLGTPFCVKPQKKVARKFLANWHFAGLGLTQFHFFSNSSFVFILSLCCLLLFLLFFILFCHGGGYKHTPN
jgi:hypothetical protein